MEKELSQKPVDESPKIGVYICHCGGNISDEVDVGALREACKRLPYVSEAKDNPFMCSDPGQEMIIEDIKKGSVNRVVIASCAPSLHELTFRGALSRGGLNPYLYEHANIREQVSWVHHGLDATKKAFKLIAAATAKAKALEPLSPIKIDVTPHATVIGGGISGLKAALELAEKGLKVTIVEATPFLGGQTAKLERLFPTGETAKELLEGLVAQVLSHPLIEVHTYTKVTEAKGFVGNFHLVLEKNPFKGEGDELTGQAMVLHKNYVAFSGVCPFPPPAQQEKIYLDTGAIVIATGFRHYTPRYGEYGYQEFKNVFTIPEMIVKMSETGNSEGLMELDKRPIKAVALIHCVGSRQIPGLHEVPEGERLNEYCSRVCCNATLQLAKEIKERYPDTVVYELYRDIRAYGRGHEEQYAEAAKRGVLFFRFEPENLPRVSLSSDPEYALTVIVKDTLLSGEEIELPVDLVVLAVGMEPNPIGILQEQLKLPVGSDGFLLEVHPKLRPVELSVNGIFLAGTCQAPMDVTEATSAACAAAAKAASILTKGYVELDPFVAVVDESKCNGCGDCVSACIKEGVITLEEVDAQAQKRKVARISPALCLGCGVCVPACPERAIDVAGWRLDHYEKMVDAILKHEIQVGEAA